MTIALQRLYFQRLSHGKFAHPAEVVRWMGAVQAQEYPYAKWALGLRSQGLTDADMDVALAEGSIIRTHILRPTWHFVTPADIGWMLMLTAPRVNQALGSYYRQLELDDTFFARSNQMFIDTLQGGKQFTRVELKTAFLQAGLTVGDNLRFTHILARAELDGVICSGGRRGKQFTYALLAERAPDAKILSRDEALAELTLRYFTSHGPATLHDYAWWSGLTVADAKTGIEMVKSHLICEQDRWFSPDQPIADPSRIYLIPVYDEFLVSYKDRGASVDSVLWGDVNPVFSSVIVLDGQAVGTWQRTIKKDVVSIEFNPFIPLDENALAAAAQHYGAFLGMRVQQIIV